MFEVRRTINSQFYWRFVTGGKILCHSETYHNKQDALSAAVTVRGTDTSRPIKDLT